MKRIIKYLLSDILRSKFIVIYFLFLLLSTLAMFQLESDNSRVILSLLNVNLLVVPLVSIMFTTIHFYNSYDFITLMLSQPVNRVTILLSEFVAIAAALVMAFLGGVALPVLVYGALDQGLVMIGVGCVLTVIFVSLAFLASVTTRDKARAIGVGLMFWFYATLVYDAFLMWVIFQFSDYPLEQAVLFLISLNPIDMARIVLMIQMDISALMGYTGAFYKQFFGSSLGFVYAGGVLLLWVLVPLWLARRVFVRKDL